MAYGRRPGWDDYFLEITQVVAKRSTCLRRQVGAVIILGRQILSTGYNGAPTGLAHCGEQGCLRERLNVPSGERAELCRGVHAEQNAIIQAARHGVSIEGATLYTTTQPCVQCAKLAINSGIKRIVYQGDYPDRLALDMLTEAQIQLIRMSK